MSSVKQQAQNSCRMQAELCCALGARNAEAGQALEGTCQELLDLLACRHLRRSHVQCHRIGNEDRDQGLQVPLSRRSVGLQSRACDRLPMPIGLCSVRLLARQKNHGREVLPRTLDGHLKAQRIHVPTCSCADCACIDAKHVLGALQPFPWTPLPVSGTDNTPAFACAASELLWRCHHVGCNRLS